ncbi:helix-turn-helix transcriptional regulator, partial [Acinetobacter baumannii]
AMALPSFMKHIHVLELSGLVQSEKSGRVRTCRLRPEALVGAEDWFQHQRAIWEARLDRFEAYVMKLKSQRAAARPTAEAPGKMTGKTTRK